MAEAATQTLARNPIPEPTGVTMDQLVEKGGDKLFDYLDDPEPGQPSVSPPPRDPSPSHQPHDAASAQARDGGTGEGADLTPEQKVLEVLEDMDLVPEKTQAPGEEGEEGAPNGDTQAPAIDLQQLSTTLGVNPDQLVLGTDGQLKVRTKVDGVVEDKSIPEVLKGYQVEQHNTRTGMQLAQEREQWKQQQQQQQQQLTEQLNVASNLLAREEQQVQARYQSVDWASLRAADPAQYAALQADYMQEMGQVQAARQQAQVAQQQAWEYQRSELQNLRSRELSALTEKMGWTEETRKDAQEKLVAYLTNGAGFRRDEVSQIFDHRVGVLASKAQKWDELNARLKSTRAKVAAAQVPKHAGGAPSTQGQGKAGVTKLNTAKKNLARSGSIDDAAAVFANIPGLLD